MHGLQDKKRIQSGGIITGLLKKTSLKRSITSLLCAALLVNTVPMDALAAHDASLPYGETQYEMMAATDEPADAAAQSLENTQNPGGIQDPGDTTDSEGSQAPGDTTGSDNSQDPEDTTDSDNSQNPEDTTDSDGSQAPEDTTDSDGSQNPEDTESVSGGNADPSITQPPQGNGSLTNMAGSQSGMASVSMSDALLRPGMLKSPAAASEETLKLDMSWPSGYSNGTLTLRSGEMPFSILPGLSGSTVQAPILKIQIPSCMDRNSLEYLDETNQELKPYLSSTNPVSVSSDGSGNTIITYRFAPKISWVNFFVNAKIKSGYQMKSGETYSIRLDYYDGSTLLASREEKFTTKNPTLEKGGVSIYNAPSSFSETLRDNTTTYDVGPYTWTLTAISGHYPYSSLKMIAPLPSGATPGFWTGSSFTALRDGETKDLGSYKVTYRSNYHCKSDDGQVDTNTAVLVYEITGGSFLSSGSSFSFSSSSYSQIPYLHYTNPKAGTYRAEASPRIECVADGRTIVMRDYDKSSHLTSVTFSEPAQWETVQPYDSWSDIIYLRDGVSVYDTKAYAREIYAYPAPHAAYSSLKMTVPLPEGAVPGFGKGNEYTPLQSGTRYSDNDFSVTYYENYRYSSGSISGTANTLVYEIHSGSGSFLDSSSSSSLFYFRFEKLKQLYLRFTFTGKPTAGTRQSAVSPQIQVTLKGQTSTPYDFNRSTRLTSVTFVEPGKVSGVYPDFVEENSPGSGNYIDRWSDTITLEEDKTTYYTKLYNRKVYSPASPGVPHYPYDLVRMTVLLPDEATPGFGKEDAFQPLTDGKSYTIPSSAGSWKVTYRKQYSYSNENGSVKGTAQALVYELSAAESTASFLKSTTSKTKFSFTGSSDSGCLYLRFEDPELKTYSSAAAPKVECVMDGKLFVHVGYFEETADDTSVTFEGPKTEWHLLSVSGSANKTPFNLNSTIVLPDEYQDDKEYYGSITNNTGYTLENVKVSYTFDQELNVDRLALNLDGDGYPESAEMVYTTRQNGTERTVSLDSSDNTLALEEGDAFLTAVITCDTLESAADPKRILTASLHNYRDKTGNSTQKFITAVPVSADSPLGDSEGYRFSSYPLSFILYNTLAQLTAIVGTQPKSLRKGDEFTVTVTTGPYFAGYTPKDQNLTLYLRMPKGYILTGYTPPAACKDGEYRAANRTLENGDILYCLEYTDNVVYDNGVHTFSFRVGPEADTSQLQQNVRMPAAVYAAAGEGKLYQFFNSRTEAQIGLDINGDGDQSDSFYTPACPTVTINPLGMLRAEGYLSAKDQIGENIEKEYSLNSTGNYRYFIFNGVGSGASMSNGTLLVSLHKSGDTFTYVDHGENKTYTSRYDVLLTEPVEPQGDFWEGCTVEYSTDGKSWLTEEQVKDFTKINQIKLQSAPDKTLESTESAYLLFPFAVHFPGSGTVEDLENYKTYIVANLQYILESDPDDPLTSSALSELTAKPLDFSGTIFQDRNWNGVRDEEEASNDKAYTLKLYSGEGTGGTVLQEVATDAASGDYGFSILLPGTYTLHVEKGEEEAYGASTYFDQNGNHIFTLESASTPVTKKLDMGILTDAVLEKPEFLAEPASPDGKAGWYVTLPQISLLPVSTQPNVETMFWNGNETVQKLTDETKPSVKGTGAYAFQAYNTISRGEESSSITSETAALDLKVDVDAPTIRKSFSCSVIDGSAHSNGDSGGFLSFGNCFRKALRITVMADDVGSGVDALYYTLPGQQARPAQPDYNGSYSFDIPMGTTGRITYYVEDKAGNRSGVVTLKGENGSDLWMLEDRAPVWEDFVITDERGNAGVRGTDGGIWYAGSVNVSARVTDEDSGLALVSSRINKGSPENRELTGSKKLTAYDFTRTVETEGLVILQAEAKDNAMNASETQTSFGIDRTAPVIVLEEKTLESDHPTATVLVKDTGSGINPDSLSLLWQGEEEEYLLTVDTDGSYRLTFPITQLKTEDEDAAYLVTAKDYTGWSAELSITPYHRPVIYVAADTGSDETGDGSRTYPFRTLETALEQAMPGGTIILLEDYDGTAYVNLEVTLDLNGKVLHADVPGSALTIGPSGSLTVTDSNGQASAAEGFERDPESEGEIFGGIPGDAAFTLEGGSLFLADGTIYCGYTGDGSTEVMKDARMMYLLTYLNGGGTGEAPELHYIEENTTDALRQNHYTYEGYDFQGWLFDNRLYNQGDEILMPGRNMDAEAKWAKKYTPPALLEEEPEEPEEQEERGELDPVPKTGTRSPERPGDGEASHTDHLDLYVETKKKEDEIIIED